MPQAETLTELQAKGCDVINSSVAAHVFAATALQNIYQGEIEQGGRGVTQEFSTNTAGSTITIIRPLPLPVKARELGASINGGNFSGVVHEPQSDSYELRIITTIDDVVDIPNVTLSMIPVSIASLYIRNISDKVTLNVNAIKIAAALYTSLNAYAADPTKAYVLTHGADKIVNDVIKTNAKLGKGSVEDGVSMFPTNDRIGLVSVDWYAELLSSNGVFQLGGANYGYDIARKGTIDAQTERVELENGYIGTLAGIPFHTVSDLVWATASEYLGFPEGELSHIIAIVKSAHGNLFGLAAGSSIKTIDAPAGQGVRLQPLYRMGAACVIAKANSILVDSDWANPYGLKALTGNAVTFKYTAPGSRRVLAPTVTKAESGKFTPACEGAVKCFYVKATAATVGDFLKAYNAEGAVKGEATLGSQATVTASAGDAVTFLFVDAQGTTKLVTEASL